MTEPGIIPIIGIDLGTTNSLVAYMENGRPRIIAEAGGERIVPSVVAVTAAGELVAGRDAVNVLLAEPERAVYSVKRLMGKAPADVQPDLRLFPFRLAESSDSVVRIRLGDRVLTPPEISAQVLRKLKTMADAHFGAPVAKTVITVPAYFNDAQRQATRDAGRIAGLEVLRLVNEPTAASLAYGLDRRTDGIIAVYDLGGGTFDISILKLHDGIFEVLATNGDTHLGGDDIDSLLVEVALEEIAGEWGEDLSGDRIAVQRLRRAMIAAKHTLSTETQALVRFRHGSREYARVLDRDTFEQLIVPVIERTVGPCQQAVADAGLEVGRLDEVVLVGGSTRIPLVRETVRLMFERPPHAELNPEEVVALGGAVQAGILAGIERDVLLLDVAALSLGIETMGGVVSRLIPRNSTIPASATEVFTNAVDGQRSVSIHVVQGERELAGDNRSLARFELKGIEPMPAGLARIEVRFLIDANGILNVAARDLHSGLEQAVEVKPSYGLSEEQVRAMISESVDRAEADFQQRQVIEARLEADTVLAATEKAIESDAWFESDDDEREAIRAAVNELRLSYYSEDYLLIRAQLQKLNETTARLAERMLATAVRSALEGKDVREL